MSLENSTTGEPSRRPDGEGRREGTPQQSKFPQRSGGVSVDSTSGKSGTSQGGKPSVGGAEWFQAKAQVGRTHKAAVFKPACEECSLFKICLPKATSEGSRAERAGKRLFEV